MTIWRPRFEPDVRRNDEGVACATLRRSNAAAGSKMGLPRTGGAGAEPLLGCAFAAFR